MKSKKATYWELDRRVAQLEEILSWCLETQDTDRLLIAVRLEENKGEWEPYAEAIETRIEALFGSHILDRFYASRWPGTQLSDRPGLIYVIRFDAAIKDRVLSTEPSFVGWLHDREPPLPEDLCLFKSSNVYPTFMSVTHEERAWLISEDLPAVRGVSPPAGINSDDIFEELLIGTEKLFCNT